MSPPSVGPVLMPSDTMTAFRPSALPRSLRGNASTTSAIAGAKMSAPPTPWSARAPTSSGSVGAIPQISDPAVNSATPAIHTRSRPTRSASRPKVSRLAAITTR